MVVAAHENFGGGIVRVAAVEVAVAATSGAFERGGVGLGGVGGRQELTAAIEGEATHAGSVVLEAFFVQHHHDFWWWLWWRDYGLAVVGLE